MLSGIIFARKFAYFAIFSVLAFIQRLLCHCIYNMKRADEAKLHRLIHSIWLLCHALENDSFKGQILLIKQQNACFLANIQAAGSISYANGCSRIG